MQKKQHSSGKTGLLTFLSTFALGLIILVVFGRPAGLFSQGKNLVDALTGSPAGWVALFGATLIIASPLIGITIWMLDRAMSSIAEQHKK